MRFIEFIKANFDGSVIRQKRSAPPLESRTPKPVNGSKIVISSSYLRRTQISMLYHIRDHILSPAQKRRINDDFRIPPPRFWPRLTEKRVWHGLGQPNLRFDPHSFIPTFRAASFRFRAALLFFTYLSGRPVFWVRLTEKRVWHGSFLTGLRKILFLDLRPKKRQF